MALINYLLYLALATALLLLIPLGAMEFDTDVVWTPVDFMAAGTLLFGAGLVFRLITSMDNSIAYRLATAVAVGAGLLLVWANLAVGLVGSKGNPANLLYGAVPAVALVGAIGARFRPRGMSRAIFAAALTHVVVTAIALCICKPSAATAEPAVQLINVPVATAGFAALWVVAGRLFWRASTSGPQLQRLA